MTDKQIITKDVDARGCKFFRNGICASPINPKCKLCVEISEKMCYYKQLKRKEQEYEKAKQNAQDTYDLWQASIESFNILQDEKIKLEQECEELEETNNTLTVTREKLLGDLYIVEESLKDYTEHYNRQSEEVDQLKTENEKLKKELSTYGATGICETCTEKSVLKCDQLEVENEELKKWKKEHLKDVEFIERNPVIDILNSMADNILLEQRNDKLKQTLTEVKEIVLGVRNYLDCPSPRDVRYEMDIILQKISEVEND